MVQRGCGWLERVLQYTTVTLRYRIFTILMGTVAPTASYWLRRWVFESTAVNRRDSTGKMSKPPREEALGMAVCGASHVSGAVWHVRPTRPNSLWASLFCDNSWYLFCFLFSFTRHSTCVFDFSVLQLLDVRSLLFICVNKHLK
jgi:hypothetical protein